MFLKHIKCIEKRVLHYVKFLIEVIIAPIEFSCICHEELDEGFPGYACVNNILTGFSQHEPAPGFLYKTGRHSDDAYRMKLHKIRLCRYSVVSPLHGKGYFGDGRT